METEQYDVVVIGAGIVGCMIARELSRYVLRVALLDQADDIGTGASAANSAILHAGHDPVPGTLKAQLNSRGNRLWPRIARELSIKHDPCGSLVVATDEGEIPALRELLERASQNGIPGARILSRAETLEIEPLLTPKTVASIWTPTAGVIDPFAAVIAAAENAVENGVALRLSSRVTALRGNPDGSVTVRTRGDAITAARVINSAGINSDDLLHATGDYPELKIVPRRGEYFALDPSRVKVRTVLFPVPSASGKGTLVAPTTFGNTMVGPNAHAVGEKTNTATTAEGMMEIFNNAGRLVPDLDRKDVIATFAGIRASRNDSSDFLIEVSRNVPGVIHLVGIDSPGFVSAPAIAERVIQLLAAGGLRLDEKPNWHPRRRAPVVFRDLSHEERAKLVASDPAYGRIICRCQTITEGELNAAIHSTIPARSYDALKRRCWIGTGRCQGGFDYNRVIDLLSRELGIPPTAVTKKGGRSSFVVRETKAAAGDDATAVANDTTAEEGNRAI